MTELIYPTVNLFLYDLRDSLELNTSVVDNRHQFWRKIDPDIDFLLNQFKALESQLEFSPGRNVREILFNSEPKMIESLMGSLGKDEAKSFKKLQEISEGVDRRLQELKVIEKEIPETDFSQFYTLYGKDLAEDKSEPYLDGYYLAKQLGDTYVLQVSSSGHFPDNRGRQPLEQLRLIKNIIIEKINHFAVDSGEIYPKIADAKQGKLGQTWLAWAQLTGHQTPEEVIEACYEQLTPNFRWKPNFKETGKLLGGTVFECWQCGQDWTESWEKFNQENYHLVLILFPAPGDTTANLNSQMTRWVYPELMRLFCYRHKMIFAYWKSYQHKSALKEEYFRLKNLVNHSILVTDHLQSSKFNLKKSELMLINLLPLKIQYSYHLNQLKIQSQSLEKTVKFYQKCLQTLENDRHNNLKSFLDFSNLVRDHYQPQIETDYVNLRTGLILLEHCVQTVNSLVQIQQVKQEENLSWIVGAVGAGFVVSSVTAILVSTQVQPPRENQSMSSMTWMMASGLCVSLGLIVVLMVLGWKMFRSRP